MNIHTVAEYTHYRPGNHRRPLPWTAIKAAAIVALLAGCATHPDRIVAVANAGECTAQDRARLATLVKQQKDARTADTIGVILVGVPVASLTGKDREAEIAVLKGRWG